MSLRSYGVCKFDKVSVCLHDLCTILECDKCLEAEWAEIMYIFQLTHIRMVFVNMTKVSVCSHEILVGRNYVYFRDSS